VIRHSQSYLFGAISGTAVLAAAVVFFVLLVSAQAVRDWPISDITIGGGSDSSSVAPAESVTGEGTAPAAVGLSGPVTGAPAAGAGDTAAGAAGGTDAVRRNGAGNNRDSQAVGGGRGVESSPATEQPQTSSPTPPSTGSTPSSGSAPVSPAPSTGGGGDSNTATPGNTAPPAVSGAGTKVARSVTKTVRDISGAATPPAPSPVSNVTSGVAEVVNGSAPPPSGGDTIDKVKGVIGGIGD
jgi:hypothetical protein